MKRPLLFLALLLPTAPALASDYGVLYEDSAQVAVIDLDHIVQMPSGERQAWIARIDKGWPSYPLAPISGMLLAFDCRGSGLIQEISQNHYDGNGRLTSFGYPQEGWMFAGTGTIGLSAWTVACLQGIPSHSFIPDAGVVQMYRAASGYSPANPVLYIPDPAPHW